MNGDTEALGSSDSALAWSPACQRWSKVLRERLCWEEEPGAPPPAQPQAGRQRFSLHRPGRPLRCSGCGGVRVWGWPGLLFLFFSFIFIVAPLLGKETLPTKGGGGWLRRP